MTLLNNIIRVYNHNNNDWMTSRDIVRWLEEEGIFVSEISAKRRINERIDYAGNGEKPNTFVFADVRVGKRKYRKFKLFTN